MEYDIKIKREQCVLRTVPLSKHPLHLLDTISDAALRSATLSLFESLAKVKGCGDVVRVQMSLKQQLNFIAFRCNLL